MLTPVEVSFATPQDLGGSGPYRRVCRVARLTPVPDGYGCLHALDEKGDRYTLAFADVEYVRALAGASREILANLQIPNHKCVERPGWPDDWI